MTTHDHLVWRKTTLERELSALKEQMGDSSLPHWKHARLAKKRESLKAEWATIEATLTSARDRRRNEIASKINQRSDGLAFTLTKLTSLKDSYLSASKDPSRTDAVRYIYGKVVDDLQRILAEVSTNSQSSQEHPSQTSVDIDFARAAVKDPRKRLTFESVYAMGQQANPRPAISSDSTSAIAAWDRLKQEMPDVTETWIKILGDLLARSAFVNGFQGKPIPPP